MEFIKNIKKDFILSSDFNFLEKIFYFRNQGINIGDIDLPKITIKIVNIDMNGITFKTKNDNKDFTKTVDIIIDSAINSLQKKSEKHLKNIKKVLRKWEKEPETFIIKKQKTKYNASIYTNKILNSDDYHGVFMSLGNHYISNDIDFATGHGSDTYYDKEYFEKGVAEFDDCLKKEVKKLRSASVKKKILNSIIAAKIDLTYPETYKYVTIKKTKKKVIKKVKPEFPFTFDVDDLNFFLDEFDGLFFDAKTIKEILDDEDYANHNLDYLKQLENWQINVSHEGYHHNDGQICEYTAEFLSPNGDVYKVYSEHSLMTGWNLYGDEQIRPS